MTRLPLVAFLIPFLVSTLVFAQERALPEDAPVIVNVKEGRARISEGGKDEVVLLPEGAFVNTAGMLKLNRLFKGVQTDLIEAKEQNNVLRTRVDEVAANPPINLKWVLIAAGSALLIGAGAGIGVTLVLTKDSASTK